MAAAPSHFRLSAPSIWELFWVTETTPLRDSTGRARSGAREFLSARCVRFMLHVAWTRTLPALTKPYRTNTFCATWLQGGGNGHRLSKQGVCTRLTSDTGSRGTSGPLQPSVYSGDSDFRPIPSLGHHVSGWDAAEAALREGQLTAVLTPPAGSGRGQPSEATKDRWEDKEERGPGSTCKGQDWGRHRGELVTARQLPALAVS